MKPKLSIGMIVKNESENLHKCLTALQPILTQVDSELIIADTGSTDGTVAIAKEFTPNVLEIEWKDDFAEARNHTVRASKGEWYMFMDADEFWKDTDELIAFFNSGEYKKYRSASHLQDNLMMDGTITQFTLSRLFKLDKNTAFQGIVHEAIPMKQPQKFLRSLSYHEGYAYKSEEEKEQKKARNRALLLKAIERDPNEMKNVAQFVLTTQENEPELHKKYLEMGFNNLKNKSNHEFFHFFYRHMALQQLLDEDYEGIVDTVREYLRKCGKPTVAAIDMYHLLGEAYRDLKKLDKAIQALEKCTGLIKKAQSGKLNMEPASFDALHGIRPQFAKQIEDALNYLYQENGGKTGQVIQLRPGNKPKLSIGMIVKNEAKNLRECLTAIQPILTRVDSELIIADTGSTDETIAIAREFTPNILQIEWNDDFAEARNHTLRAATGEWYMFMDADEFWKDTDELVDFFNSGEYKNYRSAGHLRQDLQSDGGTSTATSVRLVKIDKETTFEGRVHEHLKIKYPQKFLRSYSLHTGYAFSNKEEEQKKTERNMALMMRSLENNPGNLHIMSQICMQTAGDQDTTIHEKYLTIGFDAVKKNPADGTFHFFYRRMLRYQLRMNNYQLAMEIGYAYFQICPKVTVAAVDMYYLTGLACRTLKKFKEAANAIEQCLALHKDMEAGKLDMEPSARDMLQCLEPSFAQNTVTTLLLIYGESNDYDNFFRICRQIEPTADKFMPLYLSAIVNTGRLDEAIHAYERIVALKSSKPEDYKSLLKLFEQTAQTHAAFSGGFANYTGKDPYAHLMQMRNADTNANANGIYQLLSSFTPAPEIPFIQAEALFFVFKYDAGFTDVVNRLDVDSIADSIALMKEKRKDFGQAVAQYASKQLEFETISNKAAQWLYSLCAHAIDIGISETAEVNVYKLFIQATEHYMNGMFRPEVLTEEGITKLAPHYRFAFYAQKAEHALEKGNETEFLGHIKTALSQSPDFVKVGRARVERYKKRNEQRADTAQLGQLVQNLKAAILQLIQIGSYEQAGATLAQYAQIMPNDPDIAGLQEKIAEGVNK